MLGAAQEAWLDQTLNAERGRWTLLAQQTVVAPIQTPEGVMSDQWDGYAAARDRLMLGLTRPSVRNAVVLSGDIHAWMVNDLRAGRPDAPPVATELVTTCLAASHAPQARYGKVRALNADVRFADIERSGYTLIEATPQRLDVDLRAVADQTDPQGVAQSLARFAIEVRRPGAQPG